jgi:drug/metabolite transporter (DMT)-like permease
MTTNVTAPTDQHGTSPRSFNKPLGYGTMFVSATIMGFVGLFARNIETSGDVIAFFRMLAGILGCFGIVLVMRHWGELRRTRLSPSMIFGGMALGTCLAAYVAATQLTTLANAVFLIYTGPLISAILAWVFLREKISRVTAAFLSMVFLGMILILGLVNYSAGAGFTLGLDFSGEYFVGNMLGLASGVGYGLFLFLSRYRTDVPSDIRAFWNFVWGAIGIGIVFLFTQPTLANMDASSWVWMFAMAVICGFGALGLLTVAGRHLKAVELSTISYWECVVGAGVGFFIFAESMSAIQVLGGVLIVIGGSGEVVKSLGKRRRAVAARAAEEGSDSEAPEKVLTDVH